jgi:hypothetical protein
LIVIERQLALNYAVRASFSRSSLLRVIAHITRSACSSAMIAATFLPAPADGLYAKITPRQS